MLGFMFGTMCFFGVMGLIGGPRCHSRRGCGHGEDGPQGFRGPHRRGRRHGRGGKGGRRGGRGFGRAAGEMFKRKLDLDEDQSDLVDHALTDLRHAMRDLRHGMKEGRSEVARAFEEDEVDDATLAALFAHQDEEIQRFRREAVSALKQIHAVLDPDQRELATEWLSRGPGKWA